MPSPHFLIAKPDLILTTKIIKCWLEDICHQTHYLLINIYRRLNTCVIKRVLSKYKRLKSDIESDYQVVEKISEIAYIGGLWI